MRVAAIIAVAVTVVAAAAAMKVSLNGSTPIPTQSGYGPGSFVLDIPPRYMWGWGPGLQGYCGETSFQSAGIFFGNWVSSEEVRYASGGEELLIAVNDELTAQTLKYDYERWMWDAHNPPQAGEFLSDFVRSHIEKGHPVIFGAFEKLPKGDKDYDHIMIITGIQNETTQKPKGMGDADVAGFYFNDLYLNKTRFLSAANDVQTRQGCKTNETPEQPYEYCLPANYDYAIAIKGVLDDERVLTRMQLIMPAWTEPDWGKEDGLHQLPVKFTVSARFFGLNVGSTYNVYRYDDPRSVPSSKFHTSSFDKKFSFVATNETQVLANFDSFMSDGTIFYRTVRVA